MMKTIVVGHTSPPSIAFPLASACGDTMIPTRETLLVAASVAWCTVLACGLLYVIVITVP
jgi:hypothetical protein